MINKRIDVRTPYRLRQILKVLCDREDFSAYPQEMVNAIKLNDYSDIYRTLKNAIEDGILYKRMDEGLNREVYTIKDEFLEFSQKIVDEELKFWARSHKRRKTYGLSEYNKERKRKAKRKKRDKKIAALRRKERRKQKLSGLIWKQPKIPIRLSDYEKKKDEE